jgi:hypothetical protein
LGEWGAALISVYCTRVKIFLAGGSNAGCTCGEQEISS